MSKLLFIYETDMPTISITRDVFSNMKNHPEIDADFVYLSNLSSKEIDSHDIIIFIRPMDIYSWHVAKKAREAGHLTICFCDDDLLDLPPTLPTIPWRKKGLLRALHNSDVIWSSSWHIAKKYRDKTHGKRMVITDTILQPEELEGIDDKTPTAQAVKIVYAAGTSHAGLFEQYVKPIVPELVKEFGDGISWTFVGVHPELDGVPCEYVSGMPLKEYREYMRAQGFDIGLAPLNTDEFSKCKYFNKFIEYTTQGIMGIYTDTEPYSSVIVDGQNGLLSRNDPVEWLNTLRMAIRDSNLRNKCLQNAVIYLRDNHSEDAVIAGFEKDLPEILSDKPVYGKCKHFEQYKLLYYLSRPVDWVYMALFYIRRTGIKDVIARIKVHVHGHAYSRK